MIDGDGPGAGDGIRDRAGAPAGERAEDVAVSTGPKVLTSDRLFVI